MKLYQPVLFVGLGGTGCLIGAELERRLREEICGPDGGAFKRGREDMLRYQLPSCVQFVYADVNQADLDRLPTRVVPGPQHIQAARLTAHYVRDLVPRVDTYPEVARNLRLAAGPVVASWLPPEQGEPRVSPLRRGAGQLPTVGRAALFETFRSGIVLATRDLNQAIGHLSQSAEDLYRLGGQTSNVKGVDVFVAFSVAGGTGAGIFYDYLHLIGELFDRTALRAKIYPLVLMPSAFPEGMGGGRAAELNSGRALLDLFRLVDQQNAGDATRELRGAEDQGPINPDDVAVRYPADGRIALRPGTTQTGFLFSRPVGAEPDDLRRSVVSLVLSLVGTELDQDDDMDTEQHQSFADSFINSAVERQAAAETGIGNRGVSTALVTSLTVPDDDLADLVAGRLLRAAVEELSNASAAIESNRALGEEFFTLANIHAVFARQGVDIVEPQPPVGARDIAIALTDRLDAMHAELRELTARLAHDVPELVNGFDPQGAILQLLGRHDVFRVQRVVFGHPDLPDEVERSGVAGLMQRRRAAPPAPDGHGVAPPPVPVLRDQWLGMGKVRWSDPAPVAARQEQDGWYRWRSHVQWAEPWSKQEPRWRRTLEEAEQSLKRLTDGLITHARDDRSRFRDQADRLYRQRVGVSYLLPPSGDLDRFYQRVVRLMREELMTVGRLQPSSSQSALMGALMGPYGWGDVFRQSLDHGVESTVAELRERLKAEIKRVFRNAAPGRAPVLPHLRDLLAQAAGLAGGFLPKATVQEFRGKLAGLIPANFTPQGSGPLKILVSYPAAARNPKLAAYLQEAIRLPTGPGVTYQFKNTAAESISVVLFRSSMGLTEVREVRDVLRTWADALANPAPQDYLRWRQRTGYDFGYLATREEHRTHILHRLLCAMWNGKARADGDLTSPTSVIITLGGGVTMVLSLSPLESASSWGSLLRAYEPWTFTDDAEIRRDFCAQLMREVPQGVDSRPVSPGPLYMMLRDLADGQIARIDAMLGDLHPGGRARALQLRGFWACTLPAALDREFTEVNAVRPNLRGLEKAVTRRWENQP